MINKEQALQPGTILYNGERRYRITDVLGQGGFGITYLAFGEVKVGNVTTEAKFAIKEHFPSMYCVRHANMVEPGKNGEDVFEKGKSDFVSEARKIHSLGTDNNNIVRVNEVFEENNTAYYVMQHINGVSLTDYVRAKKRLGYEETISLLMPIIDAVGFLHRSRINHLDIKPDNIMIHEGIDGRVPVLIDFGLSVHFNRNGERTSPKEVMGVTDGYSPLEQYAGIKGFSPATDVYALAATVLFALTGVKPDSAPDLKLGEARDELSKVAPPQAVDAICNALAKLSEYRTPSVAAFKRELNGDGGNVAATTVLIEPEKDFNQPGKNKKILLTVLVATVVVAIASGLYFGMSPSDNDEPDTAVVQPGDSIALQLEPSIKEAETETKEIRANEDDEAVVKQDPSGKKDDKTLPDSREVKQQKDDKPKEAGEAPVKPATTSGTLSLGYATWSGGIKNGKPDGKGRMTFTSTHAVDRRSNVQANSGDYFVATYDNGNLVSGKLYDSSGNLIKTIIP